MYICAKCKSKFHTNKEGTEYLDRCMVCATPEEIKKRIDNALTIYSYNTNKKRK